MAPTVMRSFDDYKVFYWSQRVPHGPLPPQRMRPEPQAAMLCYHGVELVGRILFMDDVVTLPVNFLEANLAGDPQPVLHYHLHQLRDILTLVVEEKPLYLELDPATAIGAIASEPILHGDDHIVTGLTTGSQVTDDHFTVGPAGQDDHLAPTGSSVARSGPRRP